MSRVRCFAIVNDSRLLRESLAAASRMESAAMRCCDRKATSAVVLASVVLLMTTGCARRADTSTEAASPHPVAASNLDFGEQWARPNFSWNVDLQNNTSAELTVEVVNTSCACTASEVPSLTIPAHASASLPLKINLNRALKAGDLGPQEFAVAVSAAIRGGDPQTSQSARWNVHGTVRPLFQLSPGFVQFDGLKLNDAASGGGGGETTVDIRSFVNLGNVRAVSSSGHFDCHVASVPDDESSQFVLSVRPTGELLRQAGRFDEYITLHAEDADGAALSEYSLPVFGEILDHLTAVPRSLHFGPRPVGTVMSDFICISSTNGRPIKVLELTGAADGLSAQRVESDDEIVASRRNIKVSLEVTAEGLQQSELTVRTVEQTDSAWEERSLVVPVLYEEVSKPFK